jgi:hypothetical protein
MLFAVALSLGIQLWGVRFLVKDPSSSLVMGKHHTFFAIFFPLPAPCPLPPHIRDLFNEVPPRKSFWWMDD